MSTSLEWEAEFSEMKVRTAFAEKMGGPEALQKLHANGKLNARERIDQLIDKDSFREFGMFTGKGHYDDNGKLLSVTPSTQVMGLGKVDGRKVVVCSDDFTIRGGSSEASIAEKWIYADRYAHEYKLPIVRMVDTAGGSVKLLKQSGSTKIPGYALLPGAMMLGVVPVVGIALGACAGLGAVRAAGAHFSVMVRGKSQVFAGGPPVVKQALGYDIDKEGLGGYDVHRHSGVISNGAESEEEAFQLARRFLSYLPRNVWEQPPRVCTDDPADHRQAWLNDAIPRDRRKIFQPRKILTAIFDQDSVFEMSPHFGGSVITVLARINGYAVGVMINNPSNMGGALTRAAASKMERFVDLCDTFHLPMVNLVDQPGTMTGVEAEKIGTIAATLNASAAIEQSSIPWCAIVIRRCFGLAGALLSPKFGPKGTTIPHRFAWPSARWGSIPIEGGVAAAYRKEIEQAQDPVGLRDKLEEEYHRYGSPFRTAEKFGIVNIITPDTTRELLADWVEDAYALTATQLGPKGRPMR